MLLQASQHRTDDSLANSNSHTLLCFCLTYLFLVGLFYFWNLTMMNLIEQLKRHEGFRSDYYQCTANKKTIGYGRNVDNNPFTADELKMLGREDFYLEPMTEEEAEFLLVNDVKAVHAQIYDKTGLARLNLARQAVCINMAFNLGVNGFLKFKNMLKAVKEERFERAAIEALDSRWASQVGDRADELANQLATGEWQ